MVNRGHKSNAECWQTSECRKLLQDQRPRSAFQRTALCNLDKQLIGSGGRQLLSFVQGDSKKMSPLAFKSNNSRPMRCTTLPDTPFERGNNFLSNECIHTRFPFQITLSEAANQKPSGFLRVQISSNGKMCFVVPVSHLRKQALHVTARDISHEPPKGKTNSGTT